jgi:hypothetical protein
LRKRLITLAGVLALVAATVQLAAPPGAVAAPVTCNGTVKMFDGRADGTVWYYEHNAPVTGDYSWLGGRRIGIGFAGPTVASVNGLLYYVNAAGEMRRYQYNGTQWLDGGGTVVGTGWQAWNTDKRNKITADTKGRLYTVDAAGALVMFDTTVPAWNADVGIPLDLGWQGDRVIAAGDGVLYRLDDDTGQLTRYQYDADAQRFAAAPATPVGAGWGMFERVLSPGGDILYGIVNGYLNWYRYDADTGTWANNGIGKLVGSDWAGRNAITANQGTCSIPPAATVAPVTPAAAHADHAPELSGAGANFRYAYRDGQGRAVDARDSGDVLTKTVLGDKTFAGDLSAATAMDPAGTRLLLGVDAAGSLWLSEGGGAWRPFGKGMRKAVLTEAFTSSDPVQALAVDGSGVLWWRMRSVPHNRWLPWQRVATADFDSAASGMGGAYGVSSTGWFTLQRDGNTITFTKGDVPADFGSVAAAEVTRLPATLFARQASTGVPVSWGPLPALPGGTVAAAPMSATELGNGQLGVAALGADGYVYVTTGTADTGQYQPWQRVGPPAAGGAQLVAPNATEAHLAYFGQDGKLYHFTSAVVVGNTGPPEFMGKGRS